MAVPSQMSVREFRPSERPQVRIAYATAWESLVDTHGRQAMIFLQEFASRLPVLDALDLYFRVVAVPEPMVESIRVRTLATLDLDSLPPRAMLPGVEGAQLFRLDVVLEVLRHRRDYHRRTLVLARMVGARAAEAITATHVDNALALTRLLRRIMPIDKALGLYIREFSLALPAAQSVLQRAQAHLAGEQLAAQYVDAACLSDLRPLPPATPALAPVEQTHG